MSLELSVFTGGLVFEVTPKLDIARIEQILRPVLAEKGFPVDAVSPIGAIGVQVSCARLLLWFNVENRAHAAPRMRVTAQPMAGESGGELPGSDAAKAALAATLAHLARDLGATAVHWLSKDVQLPAPAFIEAALPVLPRRVHATETGIRPARLGLGSGEATVPEMGSFPVSPRRIASAQRTRTARPARRNASQNIGLDFSLKLRELRQSEEQIQDAITAEISLPLRISAWIMTLLVGVFSAPLAWVLFAFNLNKGTDFRVTANVLAATAALSVLHAAGATQIFLSMLLR